MSLIKRLVLDVLKPHQPNALEFARGIAAHNPACRVRVTVEEIDEKTESIALTVEGDDLDLDAINAVIESLGGSLHSIDEVDVVGAPGASEEG